MDRVVRLSGKKIDLCPVCTDDEAVALYLKWMNEEGILQWLNKQGRVTSFVEEKEWANKKHEREFNIIEKETGRLIGNCGIYDSKFIRCYSLGIFIGEDDARSKGYGREAIGMLVKFCFEQLCAHEVCLTVNGDNRRAMKCYEKAGFKECGRRKSVWFYDGKWADVVTMDIHEDEYFASKQK